jgi:hypothetical protein
MGLCCIQEAGWVKQHKLVQKLLTHFSHVFLHMCITAPCQVRIPPPYAAAAD